MYNPDFKPVEFDVFRKQAGLNSFVLTPKKWIETTGAIRIISKSGRYGEHMHTNTELFRVADLFKVDLTGDKLVVVGRYQR